MLSGVSSNEVRHREFKVERFCWWCDGDSWL